MEHIPRICPEIKHMLGICRAYALKHMPNVCPIDAQVQPMSEPGVGTPCRHMPGICRYTKDGVNRPYPAIGICRAYLAPNSWWKMAENMPGICLQERDGGRAIWAYAYKTGKAADPSRRGVRDLGICLAYACAATEPATPQPPKSSVMRDIRHMPGICL